MPYGLLMRVLRDLPSSDYPIIKTGEIYPLDEECSDGGVWLKVSDKEKIKVDRADVEIADWKSLTLTFKITYPKTISCSGATLKKLVLENSEATKDMEARIKQALLYHGLALNDFKVSLLEKGKSE